MNKIIGIDPGINGAISIYEYGKFRFFDIPVITKKSGKKKQKIIDLIELTKIFKNNIDDDCIAIIEDVHAFPKQGAVSTFRFGEAKGIILGLCTALCKEIKLISPQAWTKKFNIKDSLEDIKLLLPDVDVKNHHQADAAFLVLYLLKDNLEKDTTDGGSCKRKRKSNRA